MQGAYYSYFCCSLMETETQLLLLLLVDEKAVPAMFMHLKLTHFNQSVYCHVVVAYQ